MSDNDKVVALVTRKVEVNQEAIELLEKWLEYARNGEIIGVVLAGEVNNGGVRTEYTETENLPIMIGTLAILQSRMLYHSHTASDNE